MIPGHLVLSQIHGYTCTSTKTLKSIGCIEVIMDLLVKGGQISYVHSHGILVLD